MVIHERIIKFPVPEWNRVISSDLDSIAYCICYQYDFTINNNGSYGFNTERSLKIIKGTFPDLFFYKRCKDNVKELLTNAVGVKEKGVYFYGANEKIKALSMEIDRYYLAKKKNEIKLRKSLAPELLPPKPLLLGLSNNQVYESDVIRRVIGAGCGLFISHHYMPEAGDSLILFDQHIVSSLKNNALRYGVNFLEVNSIDDLKSW
jgi:hypothetical protein